MRETGEAVFTVSDELAAALQLLESLEVEVSFDDTDAESVERAITEVERAINERLSGHRGDPRVESAILRVKADFRCAFVERASSAEPAEYEDVPVTLH